MKIGSKGSKVSVEGMSTEKLLNFKGRKKDQVKINKELRKRQATRA